ncbi:MAG: hypothetical protein GF313_04800 [Caldithrix sp.]|nr:hypothetical protein [Caldithrix sp.]
MTLKHIRAVGVLTLFFTFLLSCTYAQKQKPTTGDQQPEWVHHPHKKYPKSMYLVGIGTGDTRADAENNAIGSISKIFQADVRVDETLVENYLETKDEASFTSQMLNKTKVGSRQNIKNITIAESFFDESEGLYYVLAYLDRSDTEEIYKKEMADNYQTVQKYYDNYQASSNKLNRYAFLQNAINIMKINELLKAQYQIITISGSMPKAPVLLSDLEKERLELLNNITVIIKGKGAHQREMEDYLKEVVGKIGFKVVNQQADFLFDYHLETSKANLNRQNITGYNWQLAIEVKDNLNNYALKTFNLSNRTMGISDDQATAKMLSIIRSRLTENFHQQFVDYLRQL